MHHRTFIPIQFFISSTTKAKGSKKESGSFLYVRHLNSENSGINFTAGRFLKHKQQKTKKHFSVNPAEDKYKKLSRFLNNCKVDKKRQINLIS